jgi:hypothetical protein
MPFLDLFIALPGPPIRRRIFKKVFQIDADWWLIVFDDNNGIALQLAYPLTKCTLGMHRIRCEDAPRDQSRSEQCFERADLILLLPHLALYEHQARLHPVLAT